MKTSLTALALALALLFCSPASGEVVEIYGDWVSRTPEVDPFTDKAAYSFVNATPIESQFAGPVLLIHCDQTHRALAIGLAVNGSFGFLPTTPGAARVDTNAPSLFEWIVVPQNRNNLVVRLTGKTAALMAKGDEILVGAGRAVPMTTARFSLRGVDAVLFSLREKCGIPAGN